MIDRLVKAGANTGKGEFETTEDYESRRKAINSKYGSLVFLLPPEDQGPTDPYFSYNADEGTMKLQLVTGSAFFYGQDASALADTFVLKSTLVRSGSYLGTNAFGVKRTIESSVYAEHGISVASGSPISFSGLLKGATFTFLLDVDRARAVKRFLRVALVGKLAEARVYSSTDRHAPTLSKPYEIERRGLYIPFLIEEVRVLDSRSAEIVSKFTSEMKVRQ